MRGSIYDKLCTEGGHPDTTTATQPVKQFLDTCCLTTGMPRRLRGCARWLQTTWIRQVSWGWRVPLAGAAELARATVAGDAAQAAES